MITSMNIDDMRCFIEIGEDGKLTGQLLAQIIEEEGKEPNIRHLVDWDVSHIIDLEHTRGWQDDYYTIKYAKKSGEEATRLLLVIGWIITVMPEGYTPGRAGIAGTGRG